MAARHLEWAAFIFCAGNADEGVSSCQRHVDGGVRADSKTGLVLLLLFLLKRKLRLSRYHERHFFFWRLVFGMLVSRTFYYVIRACEITAGRSSFPTVLALGLVAREVLCASSFAKNYKRPHL